MVTIYVMMMIMRNVYANLRLSIGNPECLLRPVVRSKRNQPELCEDGLRFLQILYKIRSENVERTENALSTRLLINPNKASPADHTKTTAD